MSDVIDDVLTSFTTRLDSHRSSWPRMQRCMLQDNGVDAVLSGGDLELLRNADTWFVSHGMEFKDNYNLNGGWEAVHAERLRIMIDKGFGSVVSLERKLPDLVTLLKPRAEKSEHNLTEAEWSELDKIVQQTEAVSHRALWTGDRVVLGDSHSVARYRKGTLVLRHDGLTLYGLLKRGIKNMMQEGCVDSARELVISAGNIDIRHHLLRLDNPEESIDEMLADLWSQLESLKDEGLIMDYEVTAPYPIEFEGRKLPKTGYYKGAPFFGSRDERVRVAAYMNTQMLWRFYKIHHWPQRWYEMDPEKYAQDFMEKPRSVHLSPRFHDWNYEENKPNVR